MSFEKAKNFLNLRSEFVGLLMSDEVLADGQLLNRDEESGFVKPFCHQYNKRLILQ